MLFFFDCCITQHEIFMPDPSKFIPDRIIPGYINVIPFSIDLQHVPGMIHVIADNHSVLNINIIQKNIICIRIPLAYSFSFLQSTIYIVYISSQAAIYVIFVRISNMQYEIIMESQRFIQIRHPWFDHCQCLIDRMLQIVRIRTIYVVSILSHGWDLNLIKRNCKSILHITGLKAQPVIFRMAVQKQHYYI